MSAAAVTLVAGFVCAVDVFVYPSSTLDDDHAWRAGAGGQQLSLHQACPMVAGNTALSGGSGADQYYRRHGPHGDLQAS